MDCKETRMDMYPYKSYYNASMTDVQENWNETEWKIFCLSFISKKYFFLTKQSVDWYTSSINIIRIFIQSYLNL